MPALNPYTFPLVPLAELAPELALRGGMGGWEPYGVPSPSDRLLPFVLSRRAAPSNAPWVSCAWIVNADTNQRLVTLVPTGAPVPPAVVPSLGLVLTKLREGDTEHFTYDGALIPGLVDLLPCGVLLRLVVDNAYQSPLFYALAPAASLPNTHMPLEWYHDGPLSGVPYGRGFRQRFYLSNGYLRQLDPRREQSVLKDPDSGAEVIESLSLFNQQEATLDPVPAYLAQALSAAQAPRFFFSDGQPWKLLQAKSTASGADGGRWSVTLTLEDQTPLLRRGCRGAGLPVEAFDPAYVPRGWRCGDASDTASDFLATGAFSCQVTAGANTGYVLETYRDYNRFSPSYNQQETRLSTTQDFGRCPIPVLFVSDEQVLYANKNDCGPGYAGSREPFVVPDGAYTSSVSKADANAQALAYAQANVQANANAVGTCTAGGSATYDPVYQANGCFACQMSNHNNPSDVRDATPDETDRYFRTFDNTGHQCPDCIY